MLFNTATVALLVLLGALAGGLVVLFEQWRARQELALFWNAVYDAADDLANDMFEEAYREFRHAVSETAERIQSLQSEVENLKAENVRLVIEKLDDPVPSWSFVEPTDAAKPEVKVAAASSDEDDDDDYW